MSYNIKKIAILGVIIVVLFFAGLAYHFYSQQEQKESAPLETPSDVKLTLLYIIESSDGERYITVEHDDILNVVCWSGGMLTRSCISDNQLDPGAQQKLAELLNKSKLADDK